MESPEQIDRANHPLFRLRTVEVEFEGEKYSLRALKHREVIDAVNEAQEWCKEDPSLDENHARSYCSLARVIVFPKFSPQELREGDGQIVQFLSTEAAKLNFLRLKKGDSSAGSFSTAQNPATPSNPITAETEGRFSSSAKTG
jgi:hypothetical protein